MLARRFDFAGHPLDAAPIVIDTGGAIYFSAMKVAPAAVAFDGSSFFVAWGRETDFGLSTALYTVRIDEDGQLHDRTETQTGAAGGEWREERPARALRTGSQFVVAHTIEHVGHAGGIYDYYSMQALRYEPATAAITQATPFIGASRTSAVGATLSPDGIAYAWPDDQGNGINVAQTAIDGTLLKGPRALIKLNPVYAPARVDIAWNGSGYILIWLDDINSDNVAGALRGLHLDRNLQPVESAPFDIVSGAAPLSPPRLVATPSGLLLVYSRADLEGTGAVRAFVRNLTPPPARRRAAH